MKKLGDIIDIIKFSNIKSEKEKIMDVKSLSLGENTINLDISQRLGFFFYNFLSQNAPQPENVEKNEYGVIDKRSCTRYNLARTDKSQYRFELITKDGSLWMRVFYNFLKYPMPNTVITQAEQDCLENAIEEINRLINENFSQYQPTLELNFEGQVKKAQDTEESLCHLVLVFKQSKLGELRENYNHTDTTTYRKGGKTYIINNNITVGDNFKGKICPVANFK